MRDRDKAVDVFGNDDPFAGYYDFGDADGSSVLLCWKHPAASSVGICAICLKDRLVKLVCSDCGEQRLSSCSCSDDLSSNRNSCTTVDVGSVGRISFLIESEKGGGAGELPCPNPNPSAGANPKGRGGEKPVVVAAERVVLLKRSSSSCVEIKKTNGIWKMLNSSITVVLVTLDCWRLMKWQEEHRQLAW